MSKHFRTVFVVLVVLYGCGSNPCQGHRVVQATLEDNTSNRRLSVLGITGGVYDVELDDGHVYGATYGDRPPTTGETAQLCDEVSQSDGIHHYSISLKRGDGDPNASSRKASRLR